MELHQILGTISCIVIGVLGILLGSKIYKKFVLNRSRNELYAGLGLILGGIAAIFLGLENVFLILAASSSLPTVAIFITLLCIGLTVFFQGLFTSHTFLPKFEKHLSGTFFLLIVAFVMIVFVFPPSITIIGEDVVVSFPAMQMGIVLGPIIIINIFLPFYYAFSMRTQSSPHSKASILQGIATIFFYLLFALEIIVTDVRLANYLRISYICIPILYYFVFTRFIEVDWPNKIRHLYLIIQKQGICLYNHSFVSEEMVETQLIAGSISGVSNLLQQITHSQQKLHFLDQGDIKILLEYGKYIVAALISEAHFGILRKKLKLLIELFENKFSNTLLNFSGELDPFKNSKELIDQIFSRDMLIDFNLI